MLCSSGHNNVVTEVRFANDRIRCSLEGGSGCLSQGFLELCLPDIHNGIDWSSPIENHEQELPHLFPKSVTPGRVADKLFRAQFRGNALPTWFLIHTEVQVTRQSDFAERMFTCYYRISDRFQEPVYVSEYWGRLKVLATQQLAS